MAKGTQNPAEVLRKIKALERASMAGARAEAAPATRLSPEEAAEPVSNGAPDPSSRPKMFQPSFGSLGASDMSAGEGVQEAVVSEPEAMEDTLPPPPKKEIDILWQSYGSPELRTYVESVDRATLETIFGDDDRVEVTNTAVYPWHCICSLILRDASNNYLGSGTGFLISPRVVLTAGHCLFMWNSHQWVHSVEVIPGRRGSHYPYGSVTSRAMRSVRGWTVNLDWEYDYGVVLLPEANRYGDQLGWFGYSTRSESELRSGVVNLSGYPGDKPSGTQWFHSLAVESVGDRRFGYKIDMMAGQSGAPVWQMLGDSGRYAVGINSWESTVENSATRITSGAFDNIVRWIGEAP